MSTLVPYSSAAPTLHSKQLIASAKLYAISRNHSLQPFSAVYSTCMPAVHVHYVQPDVAHQHPCLLPAHWQAVAHSQGLHKGFSDLLSRLVHMQSLHACSGVAQERDADAVGGKVVLPGVGQVEFQAVDGSLWSANPTRETQP